MKMNAHIILLVSGLAVSFLAYLGAFSAEVETALHYLSKPEGWLTLVFEASPFIALATLVHAGRAFHWDHSVHQASLVTNYVVSLLSILCYALLALELLAPGQSRGHPGTGIFLWAIPLWSWCAIAGLWVLTWIFFLVRNKRSGA